MTPTIAALVQENFLSAQTKADVIACNCVLLAIEQHALAAAQGHFQKFEPGRMSSRFCEYVFQALRAATHTSTVFTALGASRLLSHCAAQLELEAETELPLVRTSVLSSVHNIGLQMRGLHHDQKCLTSLTIPFCLCAFHFCFTQVSRMHLNSTHGCQLAWHCTLESRVMLASLLVFSLHVAYRQKKVISAFVSVVLTVNFCFHLFTHTCTRTSVHRSTSSVGTSVES